MPEPEPMKPDQERVKNLLTDTVTLLCKNGLTFSDKLRIEGLLGVSIDNSDVFFVHISEQFGETPAPAPTEEVASSETASSTSTVFTAPASPAQSKRRAKESPGQSPSRQAQASPVSSPAPIKPEPDDDDLLIVDGPKPEVYIDRAARPSSMVAGQRRAQRRERSQALQQQSSWEGDMGEPAAKRHMSGSEEGDNNSGDGSGYGGGGGENTGWPEIAGVAAEYSQGQMFEQDPGGTGFDTTTPGCSTWPTNIATPQQQQDTDGSTKKLPGLRLQSAQIRNALSDHLVQPLLQNHWKYLGFRLVWTNKDNTAEQVWTAIANCQLELCDSIKNMHGVMFFMSTITATVTMSTKACHPAIAFWVAIDPAQIQEYQLYTIIRRNRFGAELKIFSHRTAANDLDRELNTVSMVLKDFGPGYVQSKMLEANPQDDVAHLRERMYMRSAPAGTQYTAVVEQAQGCLAAVGLNFYLETF